MKAENVWMLVFILYWTLSYNSPAGSAESGSRAKTGAAAAAGMFGAEPTNHYAGSRYTLHHISGSSVTIGPDEIIGPLRDWTVFRGWMSSGVLIVP